MAGAKSPKDSLVSIVTLASEGFLRSKICTMSGRGDSLSLSNSSLGCGHLHSPHD